MEQKKKKLLPDKYRNEEVKQNAIKLYELKEDFRQTEKAFKENKDKISKEISNFLFSYGVDGFEFVASSGFCAKEPKVLSVKKVRRKSITYIADNIENALGKKKASEFVDKKYVIDDYKGLINYLKECGVNPNVFKKFISVEKTVNVKKLEQAYDLGKVKLEDLQGCYSVKEISSYIDVKIKDK